MTLNYPYWRGTIGEGERLPDGYGISHYEEGFCRAVIYPVPFHIFMGLARLAWWHICIPPWHFWEAREKRAYKQGYDDGYRRYRQVVKGEWV